MARESARKKDGAANEPRVGRTDTPRPLAPGQGLVVSEVGQLLIERARNVCQQDGGIDASAKLRLEKVDRSTRSSPARLTSVASDTKKKMGTLFSVECVTTRSAGVFAHSGSS